MSFVCAICHKVDCEGHTTKLPIPRPYYREQMKLLGGLHALMRPMLSEQLRDAYITLSESCIEDGGRLCYITGFKCIFNDTSLWNCYPWDESLKDYNHNVVVRIHI